MHARYSFFLHFVDFFIILLIAATRICVTRKRINIRIGYVDVYKHRVRGHWEQKNKYTEKDC